MIAFTRNRALLTVNGVLAVGIGVIALLWPSITARIFAFLVGALFLIEGLFDFFSRGRAGLYTWTAIIQGVVGIVIALLLVLMPGAALRIVVLMIAVWLLIRGTLHLFVGFENRGYPGFPMLAGGTGVMSVIVGLLLLFRPEAGIVAFSWLVGIYAILTGVFSLMWAQRLKEVGPEM
ncbi:MAG: HdeD family acid-resistance protein [Alkalispirochaeta sp.]